MPCQQRLEHDRTLTDNAAKAPAVQHLVQEFEKTQNLTTGQTSGRV